MLVIFLSFISTEIYAADIPEDVSSSEAFDVQKCISQKTNDCINNICITSSALDCQEQCNNEAEASCRQAQE